MEIGDWITLGAVIVALGIGVASILHTQRMQKRERKERLLNEITKWSADVRNYCASLNIGFNTTLERSQASEKYFALKFDGKSLLITIKKKTLDGNLHRLLNNALEYFNGASWNYLTDDKTRRQQLEKVCENIIEKAVEIRTKI